MYPLDRRKNTRKFCSGMRKYRKVFNEKSWQKKWNSQREKESRQQYWESVFNKERVGNTYVKAYSELYVRLDPVEAEKD